MPLNLRLPEIICLAAAQGHPLGPLSAPIEWAPPGLFGFLIWGVLRPLRPEPARGGKSRKVRPHTEELAVKAGGSKAPPKGRLGPWIAEGAPRPASPGSKPFSFLTANQAPGSQQESQKHRLRSQRDLSLNPAQNLQAG